MKNINFTQKILSFGIALLLASALVACSDDEQKSKAASTKTTSSTHAKETISHTLAHAKVNNEDKQKFEQAFAEQCVQRELRHSDNPDYDKARFEKPCTCIATYMMKDLTAIEAEKFLVEHENVQSLKIKYDNAAYHCLQEKAPAQDPAFTHNQ
jgi:membrane-bound lytic murein transglycosylase